MDIHNANPKNWTGARWGEVIMDVIVGGIAWTITQSPLKGIVFGGSIIVLSTLRDILFDTLRERKQKKKEST